MIDVHPARPGELTRRVAATLALVVAALLPAGILAALTPTTWAAATRPDADAGSMLAGLAAAAGWLVVLRLLVTALAVALASAPGQVGSLGRRTATAWSPALARRLVRAGLGIAVVAGPAMLPAGAFADPGPYPTLDRVILAPAAAGADHPGTAGGHVRASEPGSGHVVVVRPGDSLWAIAAAHLPPGHSAEQVAQAWPRWYAANRCVIGPDPDVIRPGTTLVPPPAAAR